MRLLYTSLVVSGGREGPSRENIADSVWYIDDVHFNFVRVLS